MPTITHSITLQPGETFRLPTGATLIATTDFSAIQSDCVDIPSTGFQCYEFAWEEGYRDSGSESHEIGTQFVGFLVIGANSYNINKDSTDVQGLVETLTSASGGLLVAEESGYVRSDDNNKTNANLCFRLPSTLKDTTRIGIYNERLNDAGQTTPIYWVYARDIEGDCACPTVS